MNFNFGNIHNKNTTHEYENILIEFSNGIYDLKKNILRHPIRGDVISFKFPVDYHKDDNQIQEFNSFLEKIFPDKSIRDYFIDSSADILLGESNTIYMWHGNGVSYEKSCLDYIFQKTLGKKYLDLSINERKSYPKIDNSVRLTVIQNPGIIHLNIFREFYDRSTIIICNDIPNICYNTKEIWNNVKVIPFESTFCDNAPSSYEQQLKEKRFPRDHNLFQKNNHMIYPFICILLEHKRSGLKASEPKKVTIATNIYKQMSNYL